MKIDKSPVLAQAHLTSCQAFFMGCFYNLAHDESLDSERVSTYNPMTALQELLDLYEFGSHYGADAKRVDLVDELRDLFSNHIVLQHARYSDLKDELREHFSEVNNNRKDGDKAQYFINQRKAVISSFARELLQALDQHYVADGFDMLSEAISEPDSQEWSVECNHFKKIRQLTDEVASGLIWRGAGLKELHSFYRNILIKRIQVYDFQNAYDAFRTAALKPDEKFDVTFTLRSEKLVEVIARAGGQIVFGSFNITNSSAKDSSATIQVVASSGSIAGIKAFDLLSEVIDAISYSLGREKITVQTLYYATQISTGRRKEFQNRKHVPNPNYEFPEEKFSRLLISFGDVSGSDHNRNQKILTTFRLYRIGVFTDNLEAKFITYWSAMESIARDAILVKGGDDDKVIAAIAPCVVIDYVNKRLSTFLTTFHHINILVVETDQGDTLDIGTADNLTFFRWLQIPASANALIAALSDYKYFKYQVSRFAAICQSQQDLDKTLRNHHAKVKQHLKRIYRARNLITHSGGKVANLEFLCANLEHYLKTCVNSVIDLMPAIPSVRTPEEGFIRYAYHLEKIKIALKSNTTGIKQLEAIVKIQQ